MPSFGEKRGRDDVDDEVNNTVGVTSSDEDDDDDSDAETLVDLPYMKKLTDEELSEYYRRSFRSKGFDVPDFGCALAGGISPINIEESYEELLSGFAKQALQVYNDQNNANFEFDHLVKANGQAVAGLMYYITFTARSGDNESQNFRAKVWEKIMEMGTEVKFCEMETN